MRQGLGHPGMWLTRVGGLPLVSEVVSHFSAGLSGLGFLFPALLTRGPLGLQGVEQRPWLLPTGCQSHPPSRDEQTCLQQSYRPWVSAGVRCVCEVTPSAEPMEQRAQGRTVRGLGASASVSGHGRHSRARSVLLGGGAVAGSLGRPQGPPKGARTACAGTVLGSSRAWLYGLVACFTGSK